MVTDECVKAATANLITMTSRNHLSPTVIVDKNGKTTTVHRKNGGNPEKKAVLPAPSKAALPKKQKPFKPSEKQLVPVRHDDHERIGEINSKLLALTGCSEDFDNVKKFSFDVSDVDFYSVRGAVRGMIPTSMLLHHGIRSGEEAKDFLTKNGLAHLVEDHSGLTEKALRKGIPALLFSEFSCTTHLDDLNEDDVVDALGIYQVAGYREASAYPSVPVLVAQGEIDATDLKTVGVKYISNRKYVSSTLKSLKEIKEGGSKFDAAELRQLMDSLSAGVMRGGEITRAVTLASHLGVEDTINLRSIAAVHRVYSKIEGRISEEETGKFLRFVDAGGLEPVGNIVHMSYMEALVSLYRSGIDPVVAGKKILEGVDAATIVSDYLETPKSILSGWL